MNVIHLHSFKTSSQTATNTLATRNKIYAIMHLTVTILDKKY